MEITLVVLHFFYPSVSTFSRAAAPREVYAAKLTGSYKHTFINNLFSGSGCFTMWQKTLTRH